jgi:hypothetical protein
LKIILSPSKTQSLVCPLVDCSRALFNPAKSLNLFGILKDMDKIELGRLFKIKDKLLDYTYNLYQSFDVAGNRFDPILCYDGVVYEALGIRDYTNHQRNYLEEHVVVLSAMYGIVEPGTGIWPYRLDFKIKPLNMNLYDYWQEELLEYFSGVDTIVNLASEEFSSILKPLKKKLLNIHFIEEDGRVLSYKVKKARGLMADAIVNRMLDDVAEFKSLVINDYIYDEIRSDSNNYFYKRGGV